MNSNLKKFNIIFFLEASSNWKPCGQGGIFLKTLSSSSETGLCGLVFDSSSRWLLRTKAR